MAVDVRHPQEQGLKPRRTALGLEEDEDSRRPSSTRTRIETGF